LSVQLTPFHIAIQVRDIAEALHFYTEVLDCRKGRCAATWVDLDLYGHQLVCHLDPKLGKSGLIESNYSVVDGNAIPVPHCGVVLRMGQWNKLADKLGELSIDFIVEPTIRFEGQIGEQATLFFLDPSGNALEFKAFKDISSQLFAY